MKCLRWMGVAVALALSIFATSLPSFAGNNVTQSVGVCDPTPYQGYNCVKPNSDGSVNVNGTFSATIGGFQNNGFYGTPLAVTTTSANEALPLGSEVAVMNPGANAKTAYVTLGTDNTVTATTSMIAIPPGGGCVLVVGANTYIAAITGTGDTTTLNVAGGTGLGNFCWGGGAAGGSSSNSSVSATGGAVPGSATYLGANVGGNLTGLSATVNGLKVDGSAVSQPVTAAALPLPSGASTSANQSTEITSLSAIATNTTGASTAANQTAPQGSATGGTAATKSELGGGIYNSAAPTLTTGQQAGLQMDANGNLKVAIVSGGGSGGTASSFGAAFPSTGTAIGVKNGTNMTNLTADASGNLNVNVAAGTGINPNGQTTMANSAPVTIASDQSAVAVKLTPQTSGGNTPYSGNVSTTVVSVKGSAGQLYGWYIDNSNTSMCYLQIFNVASGSVTLGTTAPTMSLGIPASSSAPGGANIAFSNGIAFGTAISVAATTTRTGSAACTNGLDVNLLYQ